MSTNKGKMSFFRKRKSRTPETNLFSDDDDLTRITVKPHPNTVKHIPPTLQKLVENNDSNELDIYNRELKNQIIESKKLHDEHNKFLSNSITCINNNLKLSVDSFKERLEKIEVDKSLITKENENLKEKLNLMYICMVIITILESFVVACFAVMR
jgi:hypothetical protein